MDRQIVFEKLESLRRCVQRVSEKCPADAETLTKDFDLQDIIALNLSRAVQLCVDIAAHYISGAAVHPPETMGQTFDVLMEAGVIEDRLARRLKKAVGFRNIAVHNYENINWQIVHALAQRHLNDFTEFAGAIAAKIDSGE